MIMSNTPPPVDPDIMVPTSMQSKINQQILNELIKKKKKKTTESYSAIADIISKTERVYTGEKYITHKKEFRHKNGKFVKEGTPYHIHYTKDLKEYFMTEAQHGKKSELIYGTIVTIFSYYNSLNRQQALTIPTAQVLPTEADYLVGSYMRYFARKANDVNSTSFEIKKEFYNSSPLYEYVSVPWSINGGQLNVYKSNTKSILIASRTVDISRIVFKQQYYRLEKNLTPRAKVLYKLNMNKLPESGTLPMQASEFSGESGGSPSDVSGY